MLLHPSDISSDLHYFHNPQKKTGGYPAELAEILGKQDSAEANDIIRKWDEYAETPLHTLPGLAKHLCVGRISYKDEGPRFGLGSFKALGGAYGVMKFLQKELSAKTGSPVEPEDILAGRYKDLTKDIMVTTATDGNHGRSVAWGARLLGCPCRIYIHKQVSQGRKKAMEALGAEVIQIDGTYDDSVNFATQEAEEFGWNIISDTSYEGYMEIPRYILAGYTVMVEEIFSQLDGNDLPTHIFLQGGVGGLASAIAAYAWEKFGANCPRIVVVEPSKAPCLMASAISGQPTTVTITEETMMAGLSCGKASLLSWAILEQATDDFVTIPDTHVAEMMRTLSKGVDGDPKIVAGESAVAGLAALDMARAKPETFAALDLDADSHVLIIGTEGATDPEIYNRIISE